MLILTRKPGQSIVIDGRIVVTFLGPAHRGRLSIDIGISAPADVPVMRQELEVPKQYPVRDIKRLYDL